MDRWIELYTKDGNYWMPVREDQEAPDFERSHIYDDHVMKELRLGNFVHPLAASKDYKIRHIRVDLINCEEPQKSMIIYL